MTRRHSLPLAVVLGSFWFSSPAFAGIASPGCDALAAWAAGYQRGAEWRPNQLGSRHWVPALLAAPATAELFGKPMLAWTEAEAGGIVQAMLACERDFARSRQFEQRNAIETMRGWIRNNATAYLRVLAAARAAVPASLAALDGAPTSPQLLRFYAALARAGANQQAFNAANQAASQVQGEPQGHARALLAALRDLPEAEIGPAVAETANARAAAMRGTVRDALIGEIGRLPVNAESLVTLANAPQSLRQHYAGALGAEDFAAIDRAITERRATIGAEAERQIIAEIAAAPGDENGFVAIDRAADERVLRLLAEQNAARVRDAASAQRKKTADALFGPFQQALARLPTTQDGLDAIDGEVRPMLAAWPASAAEHRPRFQEAIEARRTAILAAVNRAEAGAMRGRVYQGGGVELEFLDRTRTVMKMGGGQAITGTYTEERDGRVIVTMNNQALVLVREGRTLTGGPVTFRRTR
jgi:hypothetical protein